MYIRASKSGPRTYVRLAESYRDENGKVRQRHLANLGRIEAFEEHGKSLVESINRLLGGHEKPLGEPAFAPARAFGDSYALQGLWNSLQLTPVLARALRSRRRQFDVVDALRVMVFNRLCDPSSKLGALRWLEDACVPGITADTLTHQQLLRAMDALEENLGAVRKALATQIKPLLDDELTVAFYDLTTIRVHGQSELADELRHYGCSKELEGGIARQYLLAVVQSECGLPLDFAVFEGNTAEVKTLLPVLNETFANYRLKRAIVVADRGLLSLDNIEQLEQSELDGGASINYLMALPAARYRELKHSLAELNWPSETASVLEHRFADRRLVIAHDPQVASVQRDRRREKIEALCMAGDKLAAKLDRQDQGQTERGRRASDRGAYKRFGALLEASAYGRFIQVNLDADRFAFDVDEQKLKTAELFDGKLFVLTDLSEREMNAEQVIARYKSLADIESGFRVLKHDIDIAPVHHRLPSRLRAHSAICFLALLLHRLMRNKLRAAGSEYSPQSALRELKRVQRHYVTIGNMPYAGISKIESRQRDLFNRLGLRAPSKTDV